MTIKYTKHAETSLRERKIGKDVVEELLNNPQQILKGGGNNEIAQGIFNRAGKDFLLRIVYKKEGRIIKVITTYWTSKVEKYWEGKR